MSSILTRYVQQQLTKGIVTLPAETYEVQNEYGLWLWDVTTAVHIAPRFNALCLLELTPLRGHIYDPAHDPQPDEPHYPIHRDHALTTNLNHPITLLQVGRPDDVDTILFETIIDGWHRAYHALATGLRALPTYIIPTRAEPALRLYHEPKEPAT